MTYIRSAIFALLFVPSFAFAAVSDDGEGNATIFISGDLGGVHAYSLPSETNLANGDNAWGPLNATTAFTTSDYFGVNISPEIQIRVYDVATGGTCIGLSMSACDVLSGGYKDYWYNPNGTWSYTEITGGGGSGTTTPINMYATSTETWAFALNYQELILLEALLLLVGPSMILLFFLMLKKEI